METLKALIRSQNNELVQLKTMISEQKKERVDQMKVIPPMEVERVTLRNNRWNDIIASAGEAPDDTIVEKPSKEFVEIIEPIKASAPHAVVVQTPQVTAHVEVIIEKSQPSIQITPPEPQNDAKTDFVEEPSAVILTSSEVIQEPPALAIEELYPPVDVIVPSPLTIEDIVDVVFPAKCNRISKNDTGDNNNDFQVTVKADVSVDDMFFQLRQEAAKQVTV